MDALAAEAPTEPLPPATRPDEPYDVDPTLPGVLYVAHLRDLAITPPTDHPARRARLEAVATRGDARDYLEEVRQRYLAAATAALSSP